MRHLVTMMGVIAALITLLVVTVEPVLARSQAIESTGQPQDVSWILVMLIGGLVLLAGVVWLRRLRRILP